MIRHVDPPKDTPRRVWTVYCAICKVPGKWSAMIFTTEPGAAMVANEHAKATGHLVYYGDEALTRDSIAGYERTRVRVDVQA